MDTGGANTLFGLCLKGEPTAAVPPPEPTPAAPPAPAPTPTTPARVDRTAPRVVVAGVSSRGCRRRAFNARFRISETNLRRVEVFLDGRRVARTTRKVFSVRVPANRLRAGRHRLRVVATDRSGNRRTVSRAFARCAQAGPVFTG